MHSHHDPLREDVERRQRNTVWPDSMRNAMVVDGYLWKGNPKAPTVQRVGAAIFGVVFILFAAAAAYLANYGNLKPLYLFTIASGYVGFRMLRNAFKRK
jgi:hypothetical protein